MLTSILDGNSLKKKYNTKIINLIKLEFTLEIQIIE